MIHIRCFPSVPPNQLNQARGSRDYNLIVSLLLDELHDTIVNVAVGQP